MPILINNKQFTDEWGNVTSFYKSNAGDKVTVKFDITANIYADSVGNPFIFNPLLNEVQTSGTAFEQEGFRFGDLVQCVIYNSDGSAVVTSWAAFITYIDGTVLRLDAMPSIPDVTLQEIFQIRTTAIRDSLQLNINHIPNGATDGDLSLIDAEQTALKFDSLTLQTIGTTLNGVAVGKQSGQYVYSATLKRNADGADDETIYELTIVFANSGLYDETWFQSADCLKLFCRMLFSRFANEPFEQTQLIYNDNANTGRFNEPHNVGVFNATLVQGVDEIDYSTPTVLTIKVDGAITDLGIGGSYIPTNDDYYKSKPLPQQNYGYLLPTTELAVGTFNSQVNPDNGAGWSINVTSVTTLGTVTTIVATFTPNSQFTAFVEALEEEDRLFYLWVKCGNLNLLAFADQLTKQPPVGGDLVFTEKEEFIVHGDNDLTIAPVVLMDVIDTEDDVAFLGKFLMDKNGNYTALRCRIEAFNDVTLDDFTLFETVFNFGSVQVDGSGVYLFNESLQVIPQLPSTSNKRNATLTRVSSIDTPTQFGVQIYYPMLSDWRYWFQQLNANAFFYPNQNKNWQGYSQVGDWQVRMEFDLIKDGLNYTYAKEITIRDYNADDDINSSIEYIRVSDNTVVSGLIFGELMRIKSTHDNLAGTWSNKAWGMITIEPKEQSPRYISSTVVEYDGNIGNPLYPITGNTATLTITGSVATIECYLDTTKLSGTDFSIGAKIFDGEAREGGNKVTSPDNIQKLTSPDNANKTMA